MLCYANRMKCFSTLLISIITFPLFAQTGIIEGTVTNGINNEPLPFVTVIISGTEKGTQTGFDGKYMLDGLEPGLYNLEFSFIGYKKKTVFEIQVTQVKPYILDVALEEDINVLEAVEIKSKPGDKTEESPLSMRTIGVNEIQRNPGGNRDISRVIQSLPGVTFTPSFRNDIIIRGGAPGENRFYLDGVEVPNINHFATQGSSGGPVGMINVDFIREVEFYAGAFPAKYGNALSSVMEFEQRQGRTDHFGGTFTIGSSDIGLSIEGPTSENASLLFSARRSYLQFLFGAIGLPFLPTYNDFQFKEKIKINEKNEFTIIGLGAIDQFQLNTEDDTSDYQKYVLEYLPVFTQWNYTIGSVYKHYRKNGTSTFVLSRNMLNNRSYKYAGNIETEENLLYDYSSTESENKCRYEENMQAGAFRLQGGAAIEFAKYTNTTYQQIPLGADVTTIDFTSAFHMFKWGLFGQVSRQFFEEKLTLSAGIRGDANNYSPEMQNILQQLSPRFSASYAFTDQWSVNFNTGIYYQLPAYTILGYRDAENDLVNKENGVRYMESDHFVAGVEYRPSPGLRISAEGFIKMYRHYPFSLRDSVALANLGADYGVIGNEPVNSTGEGRSYGAEFLAQQRLYKNFYGILAITFVRSEFADKHAIMVPSAWDNKTIIALTAGKKFKHNWEAGIKWRYSGGLPYTPYDIQYSSLTYVWDINHQALPDYDQLNTQRLAPYHQLDMRIDKKWYLKKMNINVYVDVQNVYKFQTVQQPFLDVVKDVNGNPVTDPEDPARYQTRFIENTTGNILPGIGLILEI